MADPVNSTYYIQDARMRLRIELAPDTHGFGYDLTYTQADDGALSTDVEIADQVALEEKVLARLGIINLDVGRQVINKGVSILNQLGLGIFRAKINRAERKDRLWRHDTPEHIREMRA